MAGTSLPSVSSSDNGKVLTVVNGSWVAFNNGSPFNLSGSYNFGADYWNYRGSGKTVTIGTIEIDSSYSYIEILSSTIFTMNSSDRDNNTGSISFPSTGITITKGNEYKVTGSLVYVYGAFIKVTYSGTTVSAIAGFSSAAQVSLSGGSNCQLAFKAYI